MRLTEFVALPEGATVLLRVAPASRMRPRSERDVGEDLIVGTLGPRMRYADPRGKSWRTGDPQGFIPSRSGSYRAVVSEATLPADAPTDDARYWVETRFENGPSVGHREVEGAWDRLRDEVLDQRRVMQSRDYEYSHTAALREQDQRIERVEALALIVPLLEAAGLDSSYIPDSLSRSTFSVRDVVQIVRAAQAPPS